jgi:hypothetical protein
MAMNHKRKEKGLRLIAGQTDEESVKTLTAEEFTQEEIAEILTTASAGTGTGPRQEPPAQPQGNGPRKEKPIYFEEWRVEIKINQDGEGNVASRSYEKLKRLRSKVKITQGEADTLNHGALNTPHKAFALMYLLPGEGE